MDQQPSSSTADSADVSGVLLGHQRHNGFERPFSRDQVISWLGHSISALCFYVAAAGLYLCTGENGVEEENATHSITTLTLVVVAVHLVDILLLLTAWRSCETIDPAKHADETLPNGWLGVKLRGPRWDKTRYCALCRKAVPGLDHHCTWLQTCIGKANYAQFFTVACTGTLQFVLQVVYAALCLLWLHAHPLDAEAFGYVVQGCLMTCLIVSVPCTVMYFILLGFHLWLMVLGYGTYEWMLRRRKEQRAKMEAKKKKKTEGNDAADGNSVSTRESRHSTSLESNNATSVNVEDPPAPGAGGTTGELTSL
ncbi:hypothetical protein BBJ28_00011351 [Nothophytophthora sp. Chile5]|nr:hypothetical protein BBJ28_00011351 [Nothophytophthora sp. Chile5]